MQAATVSRRHSGVIRVTHWINAACFLALCVSGYAILIAHPRFYWGWTGYFDTPAAFSLPLAVNLDQTGWGRNLHFLAAWITLFNGLLYVGWSAAALRARPAYSVSRKAAYAGVVFVLLPLMILSGLTMSPGITAAYPQLFGLFGGRQSARTIHFLLGAALVAFLIGHVAMTILTGFRRNMRNIL